MNVLLAVVFIILLIIICIYLIFNANGPLGALEDDKTSLLKLLGEYTIPFYSIHTVDDFNKIKYDLDYPLIFKPSVCSARSKRVEIIYKEEQVYDYLNRYPEPIIIQKYIEGREAVFFVERNPITKKCEIAINERIFDTDNKKYWIWKMSNKNITKKNIDRTYLVTDKLKRHFERVMDKLPGISICRFDVRFRSDENIQSGIGLNIIEVNLTNAVDYRMKILDKEHIFTIRPYYYFIRFILIKIYYGFLKLLLRDKMSLLETQNAIIAFREIQFCERE